jgi:A/G-specific adenine glycosylase
MRQALLHWFDRHRRELPWREKTGTGLPRLSGGSQHEQTARPGDSEGHVYRVWISEIMLQQTRVAAVLEHYGRFLRRFPDVRVLAKARLASVLAAWSGLGYYRRARMMHEAARQIVRERGGKFPEDSDGWRQLPGIGRYTAAAIASICYSERSAVVDGNVRRVLGRFLGVGGSMVWTWANRLLSWRRPGDFNQAMMELGATLCTPRAPRCEICPISRWCVTRAVFVAGGQATSVLASPLSSGRNGALARMTAPSRRQRGELSYLLLATGKQVLLIRRGEQETVMPGMWELPLAPSHQTARFTVRHAIMDTDYVVRVIQPVTADTHSYPAKSSAKWFSARRAAKLPLTGVSRKILRHAGIIE